MAGFAAPTKISCTDHNGHSKLYVAEWDGTKWTKKSDWIEPLKDRGPPADRGRRQGLCREEHRLAQAHRALREVLLM